MILHQCLLGGLGFSPTLSFALAMALIVLYTYKGGIKGSMEIHGVAKDMSIPVTITVNKDGSVTIESEFSVRTADHNIKIPTMVVSKVAEVVKVTVKSTLKGA